MLSKSTQRRRIRRILDKLARGELRLARSPLAGELPTWAQKHYSQARLFRNIKRTFA